MLLRMRLIVSLFVFMLAAWIAFQSFSVTASPLRVADRWIKAVVGGDTSGAEAFMDGDDLVRRAILSALKRDPAYRKAAFAAVAAAARDNAEIAFAGRPQAEDSVDVPAWPIHDRETTIAFQRPPFGVTPRIVWPWAAVRLPFLDRRSVEDGMVRVWYETDAGIRFKLRAQNGDRFGSFPVVPGRLVIEIVGPLGVWRAEHRFAGAAAWDLSQETPVLIVATTPYFVRISVNAPQVEAWVDGHGPYAVHSGDAFGPFTPGRHAVRVIRRDPWGTAEAQTVVEAAGEISLSLERTGDLFWRAVSRVLAARFQALEAAQKAGVPPPPEGFTPPFRTAFAARLKEAEAEGLVYDGALHRLWLKTDDAVFRDHDGPDGRRYELVVTAVLEYGFPARWRRTSDIDVITRGNDAEGAAVQMRSFIRAERITAVWTGGTWRIDDLEAVEVPAPFAAAAEAGAAEAIPLSNDPLDLAARISERTAQAVQAYTVHHTAYWEVPVGDLFIVGVDAVRPPDVERDGERLRGREVEWWTAAAKAHGMALVFRDLPTIKAFEALQNGAIDIAIGGFSPEELKRTAPSESVIYRYRPGDAERAFIVRGSVVPALYPLLEPLDEHMNCDIFKTLPKRSCSST
ncbi:MAG: hypothetical protein IMW86_06495 [Hydrogenibacillus sp.]|nr:hypothetical protein [Hydrogenibacillus sp.]